MPFRIIDYASRYKLWYFVCICYDADEEEGEDDDNASY